MARTENHRPIAEKTGDLTSAGNTGKSPETGLPHESIRSSDEREEYPHGLNLVVVLFAIFMNTFLVGCAKGIQKRLNRRH